jgi:hypothetical protein
VNEIHLNENVKVETNSLLFPSEFELEQVVVKTKKYSQTFRNVTSIMISEYSRVMIEANNATIESGNGLYARLNINSTFFVKPYEGFIDLEITANNEEISMTEINQISITQNNTIQLLTRTPTIQSTSAIFVEFYPQGSLRWRTRTYGQNLKVTGSTEFSVMFSDSYSALENIKLGSLFQRDPPIVMFDFFSTFQTAIFWTLLILPIFIGIFFVFWSKNTRAK